MAENLFEDIVIENISNLEKETDIQVQEAQKVPNRINPKRSTPRHIVIKMTKIKDESRILKIAKEKQLVMYEETHTRPSADFLAEAMWSKRE